MNNDMPDVIYARPVGASKQTGESTSGPWSLEDTYGTSDRYVKEVKPSTDFTDVYNNPCSNCLFFDRNSKEWFVGWYAPASKKFFVASCGNGGFSVIEPSHWLPLPNNP